MKYFIDTEFIEDFHKPWFGKRRHYIDLISIGIVAEDGREYYAISNEFDVDYVWNKYEVKSMTNLPGDSGTNKMKVYWLRDNVLKPIFDDLHREHSHMINLHQISKEFTLRNMKLLLRAYGKSNKIITIGIYDFVNDPVVRKYFDRLPLSGIGGRHMNEVILKTAFKQGEPRHEFYGYYADYDWALLCSLYGKMINLPDGYPMYCRDVKQSLDEAAEALTNSDFLEFFHLTGQTVLSSKLKVIKEREDFPKESNEHHALSDARWVKQLYDFIPKLKK